VDDPAEGPKPASWRKHLGYDQAGRPLHERDQVTVVSGDHSGLRGTATASRYADVVTVTSAGPQAEDTLVLRKDVHLDPGERFTAHAAAAREIAAGASAAGLGNLLAHDPAARHAGERFVPGVLTYAAGRFEAADQPSALTALLAAERALARYPDPETARDRPSRDPASPRRQERERAADRLLDAVRSLRAAAAGEQPAPLPRDDPRALVTRHRTPARKPGTAAAPGQPSGTRRRT
jgi:hypothetical protein